MNELEKLRHNHEAGAFAKQDYIEAIHARHAALFDYPAFIAETDVESLRILPEGIFVRSRSQQIELWLDPHDQHLVPYTLMNFRSYETAETAFLKSIARNDWTIIDIGANCGWYSLALAKRFPGATIHACEPIPATHAVLERNIAHNGLDNVIAHRLGFSDRESTLEFLHTPHCSGATSLARAGQPGCQEDLEKVSCPGTTLDLFCARNNLAPQLIKCDVEGAELMVMQGGETTIATHKPVILIELLRKWAQKFGYHPNDVLILLGRHGYRPYTLEEGRPVPCPSIHEETPETNFVFLHGEQHHQIIQP